MLILTGTTLNVYSQSRECVVTKPANLSSFESWIKTLQTPVISSKFRTKSFTTPYRIPVIVHVIHGGEPVGQGINISFDQISSQLEVLNADFNRQNADTIDTPQEFAAVASGIEIEFVPALINPSGDSLVEHGVERIDRNNKSFSAPPYDYNYLSTTIQPATYWNPDQYLNIWVTAISGNILGIAQFPEDALPDLETNLDPKTDGIIVNYTNYGNTGIVEIPYNKGRTATHEIGHWLGLYHLWGPLDGNDPNNCTEDDLVNDTPNQDKPNNFCPGVQGSTCNGVVREMWDNYMDYTPDDCMNIFTLGQVDRMVIVIENAPRRASLLTSTMAEKLNQTITFNPLPNKAFGDPFIILNATSTSGLAITYESSDTTVANINNDTLFVGKAGQASISAKQAGDIIFNAGVEVNNLLVVNKASQAISFNPVGSKRFSDAPFDLTAMVLSGLEVVFTSSNPTIVSISGNTATIDSTGVVILTATQAGNENYLNAEMTQNVSVDKGLQVITFTFIPDQQDTIPFIPVDFKSSSGLLLEFIFEGSGQQNSKIMNNELTGFNTGNMKITAQQPGDAYYEPASVVTYQFCINPSPVVIPEIDTHHVVLRSGYTMGNSWYLEDSLVSQGMSYDTYQFGQFILEVSIGGCTGSTQYLVDEKVITGVEDDIRKKGILIYPNPARSFINIDFMNFSGEASIQIINIQGQVLIEQYIDRNDQKIDIDMLKDDVYIMLVTYNQQVLPYKFIKK